MSEASLQFLGAAGTVTGSKHLVTVGRRRVLLDCGLFQGLKQLRLQNWSDPPFPMPAIDAVVLSHAHIDHSGYLPLMVKRGFRGPVYCTPGTADLLRLLLPDSGHLQEEDAERANRRSYSRHHPALPLYTRDDAVQALRFLEPRPHHDRFRITEAVEGFFRPAGHIIGAATVELTLGNRPIRLVYSGDLGRMQHAFLRAPESVPAADVLLLEATYGDRVHEADPEARLAQIVRESAGRGGALVIPAFAIGRTQELLWLLRRLEDARQIPRLPVYVDSPMAIDATEITSRHPDDLAVDPAVLRDPRQNPLESGNVHFARTVAESKAINDLIGPIIIISASGMATGGRVLHHLRLRLTDSRTTVLLPGFQAEGTRGRKLQDGADEIRIHGQSIHVRARVETVNGLSAHADRDELLRWIGGFRSPPRQTFLVHGEPAQAVALARTIREGFHWTVEVAGDRQSVPLVESPSTPPTTTVPPGG